MTQTDYTTWNWSDLADHYSDFHKDYYGFRPDWTGITTKEILIERIKDIDKSFDRMVQSEQGRETLRSEGWIV